MHQDALDRFYQEEQDRRQEAIQAEWRLGKEQQEVRRKQIEAYNQRQLRQPEKQLRELRIINTSRYDNTQFFGIIIDTGAAFKSTAGYAQYQALHRIQPTPLNKTQAGAFTVKFGIGDAASLGTIQVTTPIGNITFHVVNANTPFLLSLKDLDRLGFYLNNTTNCLVNEKLSKSVPVVRRFGHPFLIWGNTLSSFVVSIFMNDVDGNSMEGHLTAQELRQLHRRFGHPSVRRLATLLQRSDHAFDLDTLEKLTTYCKQCQKHGKSSGRFKFTIHDDIDFNYTIIVDIFYLGTPSDSSMKPVLHIVDEATRFQAARFLKDISARQVWNTLRTCWIDTYVGPPDVIVHDAGTQFNSQVFRQSARTMAITTKIVPVEAHHSIGMVERYHGPLRRAYNIISEEVQGITKEEALQMAVKAVNDTSGPEGLIPTLLVFGTYPRMARTDHPHPSTVDRANAIKKAMEEVRNLHAKRQVNDALHQRNGPQTIDVRDLHIGSDVLVWREDKGWQGPYQLIGTKDQECLIQLPAGPTTFRITSVKPYYKEQPQVEPQPQVELQPQVRPQPQVDPHLPIEAQPPVEAQKEIVRP